MKLKIPIGLDEALMAAWEDPEKLPEMQAWLAGANRTDRQQRYYTYLILIKHFRRAGIVPADTRVPDNWRNFSSFLTWNLVQLPEDSADKPVLGPLLVELVTFCFDSAGENFAERLHGFIGRYFNLRSLLAKLPLPARVMLKMEEINAALAKEAGLEAEADEAQRIREGMMSY